MFRAISALGLLSGALWVWAGPVHAGPKVDWGKINPRLNGAASIRIISICISLPTFLGAFISGPFSALYIE